ncbi:MAG: hypothetical protein R2844_19870 [Caldilineales bacterium]
MRSLSMDWQRFSGALPAALVTTPAGYTLIPILAVVALGLLPLGPATVSNAALRRTDATTVNLVATR